jgi:hypothetical protein
MRRVLVCAVCAVLALGFAGWCVGRVASTTRAACAVCDCAFSLLHENPTCRRPALAGLGVWVGVIGAGACCYMALRGPRPRR